MLFGQFLLTANIKIFFPKIDWLTQRAPDGWESPRFQAVSLAQAGSVKAALSRPTHPRVTLTVGRLVLDGMHANRGKIKPKW